MANGTQAISRALQILKAFDDDNPQWDLMQLVEATGLNKTTVHRILGALENEGLVERTVTGAYQLGSEMIALGGRAARVNNLRRVAHDHLAQLAQATGETVTLEVLRRDGDGCGYMLVIDEVLGRHLVGITQYIGTRLPLHATSTGKAILAYLPPHEHRDLLAANLPPFTGRTFTTPERLEAELIDTSERGYSVCIGELEEGLIAIGAPICNVERRVQAAICLVGPSVRLDTETVSHLAERVKATAEAISHQIGYRPPSLEVKE